MNKTNQIVIAAVAITAVIAFAGGAFYGKSTSGKPNLSQLKNGNFQRGIDGGNRQPTGASATGQNRMRSGITNGEIIKKDDKSVTLKTTDGGSKIIFFTASTTVSKMTSGVNSDLQVGTNVMITGASNSDGSIAAEMIQIRPTGVSMGFGSGQGSQSQPKDSQITK